MRRGDAIVELLNANVDEFNRIFRNARKKAEDVLGRPLSDDEETKLLRAVVGYLISQANTPREALH